MSEGRGSLTLGRGLNRIGLLVWLSSMLVADFFVFRGVSSDYNTHTELGISEGKEAASSGDTHISLPSYVERVATLAEISSDSLARMSALDVETVVARWVSHGGVVIDDWITTPISDRQDLSVRLNHAVVDAAYVGTRNKRWLGRVGIEWFVLALIADAAITAVLFGVWFLVRWIVRGFWSSGAKEP
jgi:hypothetical protein